MPAICVRDQERSLDSSVHMRAKRRTDARSMDDRGIRGLARLHERTILGGGRAQPEWQALMMRFGSVPASVLVCQSLCILQLCEMFRRVRVDTP